MRVLDAGYELQVNVQWPVPFCDPAVKHKKWISSTNVNGIERFYRRFIGFDHALKSFLERSTDTDESYSRLSLSFPVQTHINANYK